MLEWFTSIEPEPPTASIAAREHLPVRVVLARKGALLTRRARRLFEVDFTNLAGVVRDVLNWGVVTVLGKRRIKLAHP